MANNTQVRGLDVRSGGINATVPSTIAAIYGEGIVRAQLHDLRVYPRAPYLFGIQIENSKKVEINTVEITAITHRGMYLQNSNITLVSTHFSGLNCSSSRKTNIQMGNALSSVIHDVSVIDSESSGISVSGAQGKSRFSHILLENINSHGLEISDGSSEDPLILKNIVTRNITNGSAVNVPGNGVVKIDGLDVSNSTVAIGMGRTSNASAQVKNLRVSGGDYGISLFEGSGMSVDNFLITGTQYGIRILEDGDEGDNRFTNGQILNSLYSGIVVSKTGRSHFESIKIIDSGDSAVEAQASQITLDNIEVTQAPIGFNFINDPYIDTDAVNGTGNTATLVDEVCQKPEKISGKLIVNGNDCI